MIDSVIFIGAGASVPFGIPNMRGMVKNVEESLTSDHPSNLSLFKKIKSRLKYYKWYDIEALIAILQDIIDYDRVQSRILENPSVHYFVGLGDDIVDRVKREQKLADERRASELLIYIKRFIAKSCVMKEQPFEIYDEFFHNILRVHRIDFISILHKDPAQRRINCEIFTTNYDRVLEAYCDNKELTYECGEAPNQKLNIGIENQTLYSRETDMFKIFKLHGSINWYRDQRGHTRCGPEAAMTGVTTSLGHQVEKELLIYPASEKYTFREPFYTMFHQLKSRLLNYHRCYVVGYSFRDEDILGIFHDSMELNTNLEVWLIDPDATVIRRLRFNEFPDRVHEIPMEFSVEAAHQLA